MTPDLLTLVVEDVRMEARNVVSIDLRQADGAELPPFDAGSHVDVYLPDGLVRQYSLCNPSWERHRYRVAVLRTDESRGGSMGMHRLRRGQEVRIGRPRNHFPLVDEGSHVLLLAGGIGVTPLLSMAHSLVADQRPFELHYAARTGDTVAFREELSSLAARAAPRSSVVFHLDDGPASQRMDIRSVLACAPPDASVYVCGPGGFIRATQQACADTGWPEKRLHFEHFTAPAPVRTDDGTFIVRVASSGALLPVGPDRTIVGVLADAGIMVPTSCEQGVCGTCMVRVLEGIPDHRDIYLSEAERKSRAVILPCCSRALSAEIVLDI